METEEKEKSSSSKVGKNYMCDPPLEPRLRTQPAAIVYTYIIQSIYIN